MFVKKSKQNKKSKPLRALSEMETFVLNHHTCTDGEHYYLRRKFLLSSFKDLNKNNVDFDDISMTWFFVDFINLFITLEGLDPTKTSDDEVIKFFAYAYERYSDEMFRISQNRVETWVEELMKFNPKFFSDQHLDNDYKYEIYLLFKRMFDNGLDVSFEEPSE